MLNTTAIQNSKNIQSIVEQSVNFVVGMFEQYPMENDEEKRKEILKFIKEKHTIVHKDKRTFGINYGDTALFYDMVLCDFPDYQKLMQQNQDIRSNILRGHPEENIFEEYDEYALPVSTKENKLPSLQRSYVFPNSNAMQYKLFHPNDGNATHGRINGFLGIFYASMGLVHEKLKETNQSELLEKISSPDPFDIWPALLQRTQYTAFFEPNYLFLDTLGDKKVIYSDRVMQKITDLEVGTSVEDYSSLNCIVSPEKFSAMKNEILEYSSQHRNFFNPIFMDVHEMFKVLLLKNHLKENENFYVYSHLGTSHKGLFTVVKDFNKSKEDLQKEYNEKILSYFDFSHVKIVDVPILDAQEKRIDLGPCEEVIVVDEDNIQFKPAEIKSSTSMNDIKLFLVKNTKSRTPTRTTLKTCSKISILKQF